MKTQLTIIKNITAIAAFTQGSLLILEVFKMLLSDNLLLLPDMMVTGVISMVLIFVSTILKYWIRVK
ncbi:MAG: hypothetical protein ACRCXT_18620 [Paraclostridium sp.]